MLLRQRLSAVFATAGLRGLARPHTLPVWSVCLWCPRRLVGTETTPVPPVRKVRQKQVGRKSKKLVPEKAGATKKAKKTAVVRPPVEKTTKEKEVTSSPPENGSSSETIEIDTPSLLAEWENGLIRVTGQTPRASAYTAPSDLTQAQRTALITLLQSDAETYPYLYALLNTYSEDSEVSLCFTETAVLTSRDGSMSAFLTILKFYSQVACQKPFLLPNYQQLIKVLSSVLEVIETTTTTPVYQQYSHVMVLYHLFLRSLDSNYQRTLKKAESGDGDVANEERGKKKKGKAKQKKAKKGTNPVEEISKIDETLYTMYRDKMLFPRLEPYKKSPKPLEGTPLDTLLLGYLFWLLGGAVKYGDPLDGSRADNLKVAQKAAEDYFTSEFLAVLNSEKCENVEALLVQVLNSLKIATEMHLVLSPTLSEFIEVNSMKVIERICRETGKGLHSWKAVCSRKVADSVEQLQYRGNTLSTENNLASRAFSQTCTILFAAVSPLAQSPDVLKGLLKEAESECFRLFKEEKSIQRPPLHSHAAELCYFLMCCGFSPICIFQSSLCASMSVVELVDLMTSADLFSYSFTYDPLPPRLKEVVLQQSTALAASLLKERSQVVVSSPEALSPAQTPLKDRLSGDLPTRTVRFASPVRRRQRKGNGKKEEEEEAPTLKRSVEVDLQANQTFYVCLNTVVEFILRGDAKNSTALIVALFPALETEGGILFTVQALTYIVDSLFFKICYAGALYRRPLSPATETHSALEDALSSTAAALLLRVSQHLTQKLPTTTTQHRVQPEEEIAPTLGTEKQKLLIFHSVSFELTCSALLCGVSPNSVRQLNTVHTTILWAKYLMDRQKGSTNVNTIFQKLTANIFDILSELEAKQLPLERHPKSLAAQFRNIAVNEIVSNHVSFVMNLVAQDEAQRKHFTPPVVLQSCKLLNKIQTDYPVTSEPSGLYAFRTEELDGLLVPVLRDRKKTTLTLSQLSEVASVVLRGETIHLVSDTLLEELSSAVMSAIRGQVNPSLSSSVAFRLSGNFLVLCQLGEDQYTQIFVNVLQILESHLTLLQSGTILGEILRLGGPGEEEVTRRLYRRLLSALNQTKVTVSLTERVQLLQVVVQYRVRYAAVAKQEAADLPALLLHMSKLLKRLPMSTYGALVSAASDLYSVEASKELLQLPKQIAVLLLRRVHSCPVSCISPIVSGYSKLPESEAPLRGQVLGVFISRIIRAVSEMSPEEVTTCVEAYCRSGVFQAYFFGILLARLGDVTQLATLDVSVRLIKCGITSPSPEVKTACITAAKPLFLIHVRSILQRDSNLLATVVSSSTQILDCLREAFPREPVAAQTLESIARHHTVVRLPVVLSALQLIDVRNGSDLPVLQVLADHCTQKLFPHCSAKEFAELFSLLVRCGVRSSQLLTTGREKLKALTSTPATPIDGYSLAVLASALQAAYMDVDKAMLQMISKEVTTKCKKCSRSKEMPFSLQDVSSLLQFYYSGGEGNVFPLQDSVDGLLYYTTRHWEIGGDSLKPKDLFILVRACKTASSALAPHLPLVRQCAERAANDLQPHSDRLTSIQQWETMDLLELSQFIHLLLVCDPSLLQEEVIPLLLEVVYKKKNILLQRQFVRDEIHKVLELCQREVHPPLWDLVGMEA